MVDVGIEHCNDYVKRERNDGQESNLLLPWGGKCDYIDVRHSPHEAIWVFVIFFLYI